MWVPRHSIFRRLRFSFTVMAVIMYGGGQVSVRWRTLHACNTFKLWKSSERKIGETPSKANFASSNVL
jgi:hypothetical protein